MISYMISNSATFQMEGVLLVTVLSGCRPLTGTVTAARPVPLAGSLRGSRLRPSQMLKRNFKLNLKYDPVVTVPSSAVTLAY